jgi:tetratricopeptide (TPR) repeat protein
MSRYELKEEIGRGAWSVVYKAWDTFAQRFVAIKELSADAALPRNEIAFGQEVTNEHVLRIHNFEQTPDGKRWIIMELVEGGNLRGLMQRSGPLSVPESLDIARQVLLGLEAAHAQNVIHRDLKPENILLTPEGKALLSDFGQARRAGADPSIETEWPLGPPAYMAPEQWMEGGKCDARSDIFSFGVVLHELISGKRPEVQSPLTLPGRVPARVVRAIKRCLEIDPARRFASVSEVREALDPAPRRQRVLLTAWVLFAATVLMVISGALLLRKPVLPEALRPVSAPAARYQEDLAMQIAAAINARAGRKPIPPGDFSDGLYFLRNSLLGDALPKFDATLAADPNYPDAHYYRGLALASLNRADEAIEAFKRALPRAEPEQLISGQWDAPFSGPQHGIIRAADVIQGHYQRDLFDGIKSASATKRVIYSERVEKGTALHFLDLESHTARRVEIPDENIILNSSALANDSFTIIPSAVVTRGQPPRNPRLYGFSAGSSPLWHLDLPDLPINMLAGAALYLNFRGLKRIDLIDARNGNLLWKREGLLVDPFEFPSLRKTKRHGDILIVQTEDAYHALRLSDGLDAWTVAVQSPKTTDIATDRMLIVFEPERRIFTVDIATGNTLGEVELEQYVDTSPRTPSKWFAGAKLEGNMLYVMSKELDMVAIDISTGNP